MSALLQAIAMAFIRELLTSITGYLASVRQTSEAKALGRAEAERDAAFAAARTANSLDAVPLPETDELIKKLKEGGA